MKYLGKRIAKKSMEVAIYSRTLIVDDGAGVSALLSLSLSLTPASSFTLSRCVCPS